MQPTDFSSSIQMSTKDTTLRIFLEALLDDVNRANLAAANHQLENNIATFFTRVSGDEDLDAPASIRNIGTADAIELEHNGERMRIPKIAFAPSKSVFIETVSVEGAFGSIIPRPLRAAIAKAPLHSSLLKLSTRANAANACKLKVCMKTEEGATILAESAPRIVAS